MKAPTAHRARAAVRQALQTAMGHEARRLYGFDGARCDAMVAAVLARLGRADPTEGDSP